MKVNLLDDGIDHVCGRVRSSTQRRETNQHPRLVPGRQVQTNEHQHLLVSYLHTDAARGG